MVAWAGIGGCCRKGGTIRTSKGQGNAAMVRNRWLRWSFSEISQWSREEALKTRGDLLLLGAEYRSPSNRMIQFSMDNASLIGFIVVIFRTVLPSCSRYKVYRKS